MIQRPGIDNLDLTIADLTAEIRLLQETLGRSEIILPESVDHKDDVIAQLFEIVLDLRDEFTNRGLELPPPRCPESGRGRIWTTPIPKDEFVR